MRSSLPQQVLVVITLVYAILGVIFLFATPYIFNLLPFSPRGVETGAALSAVASVYGGLELALAAIFAWGAIRQRRQRMALTVAAITFAGLAGGRTIGMIIYQAPSIYNIVITVLQYIGLGFSLLGLMKIGGIMGRAEERL